MNPWEDGARTLTLDDARRMIAEVFPDLGGAAVRVLGAGWDNTAFLVDERVVVRVAMRPMAASLLDVERRVLSALPALPLEIPRPRWYAPEAPGWPFPLAGYPVLAGEMLAEVSDPRVRAEAGGPLGSFLAALHGCSPPYGTPEDLLRRVDAAYRWPTVVTRAEALRSRDPAFPADALLAVAGACRDAPAYGGPLVPCHGDLYARHVLVDEQGRAAGVIDWGDTHRGDPAVDLAASWHVVPPDGRTAFWEAYGPVDPATLQRARFRAVFHVICEWWYGVEQGDASWRDEAARGAGWVLAE